MMNEISDAFYSQATQPINEETQPGGDSQNERAWGHLISLSRTKPIFLTKNEYWLGRHVTCDLQFDNMQISNRHCRIVMEGSGSNKVVYLEDHSTNGTYVNGQKVGKGKKKSVTHLDEISLSIRAPKAAISSHFFVYSDPLRAGIKKSDFDDDKALNDKYYVSQTILGTGQFATVKLAFNKATGDKFAVKVVDKDRFMHKPRLTENVLQEIEILKSLKHPNVVSVEEVFETSKSIYIFLQLVSGGELFHHIVKNVKLGELEAKYYFYQILLSIKYLHDRDIVHRDIKSENLLMQPGGPFSRILITDFGFARIVGEESFMKTMCGTPNYLAPEVLKGELTGGYGKIVDCWSLGVVLYTMLSGELPFHEDDTGKLFRQISAGLYNFNSKAWATVTEEAKQLVRGLMTVDPQRRMSVDDALRDPWLNDEELKTRLHKLYHMIDKETKTEKNKENLHQQQLQQPTDGFYAVEGKVIKRPLMMEEGVPVKRQK